MEPNYIVLIALCVVISEAKLFIGDCSYGFCEQNCKQIKEFEMECFCKRGFALKTDGRRCIKSKNFITDDELSSGDGEASGDTGNCDNEDGNCDTTGTEIFISGDGDDEDAGSGIETSSVIVQVGSVTTSITAKYANTSFTLPSQMKTVHPLAKSKSITLRTTTKLVKVVVTPTAIIALTSTSIVAKYTDKKTSTIVDIMQNTTKVHPVIRETTKHSTKPSISELKPMKTHIDKKEISTTSIKKIVSSTTSKDVIGIRKSPVVIPSQKSSTPSKMSTVVRKSSEVKETLPSSSTKHVRKIVVKTRLRATSSASAIIQKPTSVTTRTSAGITKIPTLPKPIAPSSTRSIVRVKTSSVSRKATSTDIVKPPSIPVVKKATLSTSTALPEKKATTTSSTSTSTRAALPEKKATPSSTSTSTVPGKKSISEGKVSSVYKHIPIKPLVATKTIQTKQTPHSIAEKVNVTAPTSIVSTTTGFTEIKVVVQDNGDEVLEYRPTYNKTTSSQPVVLGVKTTKPVPRERVTSITKSKRKELVATSRRKELVTNSTRKEPVIPSIRKELVTSSKRKGLVTSYKRKEPVTSSIWIDKKLVPLNTSSIIRDIALPTKIVRTETIKPTDKIVPVTVHVDKSSSRILKASVDKSKVDKSIIKIRNTSQVAIHKLRKTIKESISSITPKTSFHAVSASPPIIEKTTPLKVIRTNTVKTSSFSQKLLRQSSSTTDKLVGRTVTDTDKLVGKTVTSTEKLVDRTVISTKVKDIQSTSSSKLDDKLKSIVVIFDGKKSSSKLPDQIEVTKSSPTKRNTDIRVVVVGNSKKESYGCTLLVNKYLLVVGTIFTIYFLRV